MTQSLVTDNSLKQELTEFSKGIGVDLFGVTSAEPFDRFLAELDKREEHYRTRYDYRLDTWRKMATPQAALPGARSVVVLGYYYLGLEPPQPAATGRFARIVTHGHLGILRQVRDVTRFLKSKGYKAVPGAHRKEAAIRAGLGMVGKHNLVINPTYGSWVAYQSIITDAPLEPDAPFTEDLCKDCVLCLDACPTEALYAPRQLDPRRCVPYQLTLKDNNRELWPAFDDYILGCDACQEACPLNKGLAPKPELPSFFPDDIGLYPPLARIIDMTEAEFQREIMAHVQEQITPAGLWRWALRLPGVAGLVGWATKKFLRGQERVPDTFVHASSSHTIYQRNAMIAAANTHTEAMRPHIERHLGTAETDESARWALQHLSEGEHD